MTDLSATTGVTDCPSGSGVAGSAAPRSAAPYYPVTLSSAISSVKAPSALAPHSEVLRNFLDRNVLPTPCLVLDLATVRHRYSALQSSLADARICYAVKANPEPAVVGELVARGASFDVASPGEIDLCLSRGAAPESVSYGNTIKKRSDIARAYAQGVRLFVTDSKADLDNIAAAAPGSRVFCRLLVDNTGARTPFGRKFGCPPEAAVRLLQRAEERGLDAYGVSFHIGSQQLDPAAWEHGIVAAQRVFAELAECGIELRMVNLGGGLPAAYTEAAPELDDYTAWIEQSLDRHFGRRPELMIEPGRYLAGDAGVLRSEVILVTPESGDSGRRWVYLDVGRYNGLAETEGEAIAYRLRTSRDGDPGGPVVLAGPTCDGDDILYQRTSYELPLTLRSGDHVDLLSAGAYTASYSSVGFNGFAPLATYCIDTDVETDVRMTGAVAGSSAGDKRTERP